MNKRKIKTWLIAANFLLVALALPLSQFSNWFSTNIFNDPTIEPVRHLTSEEALDLKVYDNFAHGTPAQNFQKILIEAIDGAQREIKIAIYAFNIEEIKEALLRAQQRGVKITLLYAHVNGAAFEEFWDEAREKIPPIYIGGNIPSTNYSMHHKFMLVDPGQPGQKLYTGSWNWSYLQEDLDPNILLETDNAEIIESYGREFQRLLENKNGFNKFRLGDFRPWSDLIDFPDGSQVEVWFSPGRERYSIQNRILDLIRESETSIDVANTIVDSTFIGAALVSRALDGVRVRVIFDQLNLVPEISIYNYLQKRKDLHGLDNLELIIGGQATANSVGQYSIFHHHNLIVDERVVLTGTANWSFGGFFLNDENFLVIRNANVAAEFSKSFDNYLDYLSALKGM